MDTKKAGLLLAGVVGAVAAILLWVGGMSVDGTDCGSALAPVSFDDGEFNLDANDCRLEVRDRRINAGVVSVLSVLALWAGLTWTPGEDGERDPERQGDGDGERLV